ncbi:MAG: hypothetical protein LBN21_01375 [Treponema sp.]|jgi:hypothetical protein|nr:hypothetical protein [Treponema sp.]
MVTVKESLEQIKKEVPVLFGEDVSDIRLEEIDGSDANAEYYLTISFLIPNKNVPAGWASLTNGLNTPYVRQYKNIVVNKENGAIISAKIHKDA